MLGAAAMRRSETTHATDDDSQQCMYTDANLLMSSMPIPLQSINQVIKEEEAAAE